MYESSVHDRDAVVSAYAAAAKRLHPHALAGPALRTRSLAVRDVFTEAAAGGRIGYRDLCEILDATGAPPPVMLRAKDRRRWTAALARVMAASALEERDRRRALLLYDALVEEAGVDTLDAEHQAIFAQLLFLAGAVDRCAKLLPSLDRLPEVAAQYLRCDLANPFLENASGSEHWRHLLNLPFLKADLEAIEVPAGGGAPPFDRLACQPAARRAGGTLVSVIMTAYRPGEAFLASVRSIMNQTWGDLELLIVDDASGPGYERWYEYCLEMDPRVRVIRQDVNGGTYVARNAGLDVARGRFVTFQDSDDWSHPRRIERQVTPLLRDSGAVATRSLAVRARPDLVHQWLGYPAQRVNASSLMFRRKPVMDRIGYFDSVRKGADAEYAFRLQAAVGREIVDIDEPLAYTRLQAGSLSRSDFSLGWAAPARVAHQAAYRHWHRDIESGGPAYVSRSTTIRVFPAPAAMVEEIPGAPAPRRHLDVVLVDDWQPRRGPFDSAYDEIAALTGAGLTVGVAHVESPGTMTAARRHPVTPIQELINDGTVDRVLLDENVTTSLLIVRDPIVLQFPPSQPAKIRVNRVVVTLSRVPTEYPGLAHAYDAATTSENACGMFGVEPEWAVVHKSLLSPLGATHVLPSPVDLNRWSTRTRAALSGRRPVIGTYDSDVSDTELGRAMLAGRSLAAKAIRRLRRVARRLARGAARPFASYRHRDGQDWHDYLRQLDFLTCFPSRTESVAPIEVIARALAAKVVVIAPHRFYRVFGDSVVRCRRIDVMRLIRRHRDASRYEAQISCGLFYARDARAREEYVDKIKFLIAARSVSDQ